MSKLFFNSGLLPGIIEEVSISSITPSKTNIRTSVDDLDGLAFSIRQKGLLQPILVRTLNDHSDFEIVAGNRRYHACKVLGWRKIACHIVELDDKEAFEFSLIENIQRKTLGAIDEANAFRTYVSKFGWGGASDLALKIGKSTSYVTKRIRLLDLPPEVVESIINSKIDTSIAEELFSVKEKCKQSELAQLISARHLSLRKVRGILKDSKKDNSYTDNDYIYQEPVSYSILATDNNTEKVKRTFDKSIITLRIAMNKVGMIIEEVEDNWIVYEVLMQHKNVLHAQIDILIRQKRKIK